eukprot:scaffold1055_cov165-Amphora_coffeaeformis.AAC.3
MQTLIEKGWQKGCFLYARHSKRHFHNAVVNVVFQRRRPARLPCCHCHNNATLSSCGKTRPGGYSSRMYSSFILQRNRLDGNGMQIGHGMQLLALEDNKAARVQLPNRFVGQTRWNHQTKSNDSFFYHDKERYRLSKTELFQHVTEIVALLQGGGGKDVTRLSFLSNEEQTRLRQTLDVNYCFDILERCMEIAKETRQIDAAHQAARLLKAMEDVSIGARDSSPPPSSSNNGPPRYMSTLPPTTPFYDVVLQSHAVCNGGKEAAVQAQAILQRMLHRCYEWMSSLSTTTSRDCGPPRPPAPTVKTFNIVANTWAKSRQQNAGDRAQHVVNMMQKWDDACRQADEAMRKQYSGKYYNGAKANEVTLLAVVDAWSKSRHPKAPENATNILLGAIEEAKQNPDFALNPELFHAVLGAWTNGSMSSRAGERAEEILSVMEQCADLGGHELRPGTRAYAVVMEVWMRCEQVEKQGRGAERAEFLLRTMTDIYRRDRKAYIKPNKFCFTNCLSAWSLARSREDAPERAEALLNLLIDMYNETKDDDFRPDTGVYNTVIAAWTRAIDRSDSMERAKQWLSSLRKYTEPDLSNFNTILDGMGKRGMGGEALKLLEWLEAIGQDFPHLLPDQITYNSTLSAIARDKSCVQPWEKASDLLHKMVESEEKGNARRVTPNRISYNIVIGSLLGTDSVKFEDVLRAQELLQHSLRMHNERGWNCKPDTNVFATLMRVCGRVRGTMAECDQALDVALAAMENCRSGSFGEVDHIVFFSCMKAIGQLCQDERKKTEILKSLFEICAAEGHVSKGVILSMKIGAWKDRAPPLPAKWSRKVPFHSKPKAEQKSSHQQQTKSRTW